MRKLKFKLDRKSLETIYIAFIRPILEYADIIWDNCSQYEKDELEKIQTEAARIAAGATKLISLSNLYKEIFWETLQQRRHNHKLILFYKMVNNLAPLSLLFSLPALFRDITWETQTISKLSDRIQVFIITLFYRQHLENGTNCLQKLDNYQLSTLSNIL